MKIAKPIRDAFNEGETLYKRLRIQVSAVLRPAIEQKDWFYTDRIKGLESFALKIETGRFPIYARMEDFYGCTVIVPTYSQLDGAVEIVLSLFELVDQRPKMESETHKRASDFTFDDLRLYVKQRPATELPPSDLDGVQFEVQIKTILQYAWGIATHDLIYKTDDVSWPKERIAYQVKAMLEHAEMAIAEAGQLSTAAAVSKQDKPTKNILKVIEQLRAVWSSPDVLPTNLKRLAENVASVLWACRIQMDELAGILLIERRRIGLLPADLSPYSFVIQALANHPNLEFESKFKQNNVKVRLVIHSGMDLPSSILEPHVRITNLDAVT